MKTQKALIQTEVTSPDNEEIQERIGPEMKIKKSSDKLRCSDSLVTLPTVYHLYESE